MRNLAAIFIVISGCGGTPGHTTEPVTLTVTPIEPDDNVPDDNVEVDGDGDTVYPPGVQSVRFLKPTVLLAAPHPDAAKVGVIGRNARAAVRTALAVPGDTDCAGRWLQLEPRGWACETEVAPSPEVPTTAADDDQPLVPGIYGYVRRADTGTLAYATRDDARDGLNGRPLLGSNSVRKLGAVKIDGRRFWRTKDGLIEATSIRSFSPSKFRGVVLAEDAPMPAWVRSARDPEDPIATRDAPGRGRVTGKLAARTVVTVHETSADGRHVRITDAPGKSLTRDTEWIARVDVRIATFAAPPPGTGPDERWFDVDLEAQILVAYEGERAVYATLVSTGGRKHPTPATITRVAAKLERSTMNSDGAEGGDVYSVADVPWTMYYNKDFALHTAYWHDSFGGPRSHGCINLAPADARALYHWSSPDVPPGWIAVYGNEANPGSLVRVRSQQVPEPAFRGYARTIVAAN